MGAELGQLDDHDLLAGGVADAVAETRPRLQRRAGADGSFVLRTAVGFAHTITPPSKAVEEKWPDLPEVQCSATEFIEVLREIREPRDRSVAESRELQWEHDHYLFSVLNRAG